METLMINVETKEKANALEKFLKELNFVSTIKNVSNKASMIEALEEHSEMKQLVLKKKNKAIAKHLQ